MLPRHSFLIFLFLPLVATAQTNLVDNKIAETRKTTLAPELDGVLDDPIWQEATVITDFFISTHYDLATLVEQVKEG